MEWQPTGLVMAQGTKDRDPGTLGTIIHWGKTVMTIK